MEERPTVGCQREGRGWSFPPTFDDILFQSEMERKLGGELKTDWNKVWLQGTRVEDGGTRNDGWQELYFSNWPNIVSRGETRNDPPVSRKCGPASQNWTLWKQSRRLGSHGVTIRSYSIWRKRLLKGSEIHWCRYSSWRWQLQNKITPRSSLQVWKLPNLHTGVRHLNTICVSRSMRFRRKFDLHESMTNCYEAFSIIRATPTSPSTLGRAES